jgi:hypothetical protein
MALLPGYRPGNNPYRQQGPEGPKTSGEGISGGPATINGEWIGNVSGSGDWGRSDNDPNAEQVFHIAQFDPKVLPK